MTDHKSKNLPAQGPTSSDAEKIAVIEPSLRWQCRRGMLELDVIFNRFLESGYGKLSAEQREQFAVLLQEPDPDLFAWLMGYDTAKSEFKEIVQLIQASNAST